MSAILQYVYTDIKLDETTGAIVVENGDIVLIHDLDVIAQRLRLTLRTIMGEWFLDTTHGVDYFGVILVKGAQQARVESELREKILGVPGVLSLQRFDASYDTALRKFALSFDVDTVFGPLTVEAGAPV